MHLTLFCFNIISTLLASHLVFLKYTANSISFVESAIKWPSEDEDETYPNLVHLPPADELSLNLLFEQFIKDKITLSDSYNNISRSSTTNYIKHWSHKEHDLKLITANELYGLKNDDEIVFLCDGCVKPIRSDDSLSYACIPCKYFMHKVCAELPGEVEHHIWPGKTLFASKYNEPFELFECYGCGLLCNGIFYSDQHYVTLTPSHHYKVSHLHIGCVTLPKVIKHEAHHHQLRLDEADESFDGFGYCNACGKSNAACKYGCKDCKLYICGGCIMNASRTYKHRWDPHPLDLIYDAGMVEEHEHDYDCEFCSEEIDTNEWFYHCTKCDLSLEINCILESCDRYYKDVKFGATDVKIRGQLQYPHRLTFLLNKRIGWCMNCGYNSLGKPVLQCTPCDSIIFCYTRSWCWKWK
ncbi:uncharacterized protein LOC141720653 [Apium graveolens]|uniref:uncharacterized protein LOC141720653 n=1 Tax=Apium graveolens TaxID=4045 RepID=UPI003D7A9775